MDELKTLEAKHGKCYLSKIYLDSDDETKVATLILRKMDRQTYAMVTKLLKGEDSLKAVEAFLKALWVGGDDLKLVTDNFDALLSAENVVVNLIERKPGELKKN